MRHGRETPEQYRLRRQNQRGGRKIFQKKNVQYDLIATLLESNLSIEDVLVYGRGDWKKFSIFELQQKLNEILSLETDRHLLWNYLKNTGGYAILPIDGKLVTLSRLALERRMGKCPPDKDLAAHDPTCPFKNCINYRHLRWATYSENSLDRFI